MAVIAGRVKSVLLADGWHVVLWEKLPDGRRVSTFAAEHAYELELLSGERLRVAALTELPGAFRFRGFPEHDSTRTATWYEGPFANVRAFRYLSQDEAEALQKREDEAEARRSGG